ncbi:universal stress protein [Microbacterium betulae]|uniref:Universal stress protein n=1 Tax=Microbacterium betulae TaxID=2981139 RepID=A0AA97I427_9MICO|nr:universal stress protein [Microbacterium sp. AB]WOF22141.1 universal stress protein [Microbacterium sp. AB]
MNDTVVVGVTETEGSRRAVDWAAQRAAERRDRLLLVSVVGGATGVVGEEPVVGEAARAAQSLLDAEARRIADLGVDVQTRVERGRPVERLIAASERTALLVIGSEYRGPRSGRSRGPHGVRITAGAHVPVVVVPDVGLGTRSGVVVGVDGSETSEKALAFAAAEADRQGEPLIAVSAWSTVPVPFVMTSYPPSYLDSLQAIAEQNLGLALSGVPQDYPDLEVRRVVEKGQPADTLTRLAASARLVVVGSHGRGPVGRFLLGSTSEIVLARMATVTVVVR